MTKLLFFDTETTGLPADDKFHYSEVDKFPRIVQLAYMLFYDDATLIESGNFIVKPIDFIIPETAISIHGITTDKAIKEGISILKVLGEFFCAAIKADYFICHNFNFDHRVLGAEAVRAGFEQQYNDLFQYRNSLCTMESTKELCNLKKGDKLKRPKLSELYFHLFKSSFSKAHNAYNDVQACSRCFFELYNQGFYEIECYA